MALRLENLPSDPARLIEMVLSLDAENDRLRAVISTFKDMVFGARSEKLAAVINGQAPDSLLDSYQAERKRHVTEVTRRAWMAETIWRARYSGSPIDATKSDSSACDNPVRCMGCIEFPDFNIRKVIDLN